MKRLPPLVLAALIATSPALADVISGEYFCAPNHARMKLYRLHTGSVKFVLDGPDSDTKTHVEGTGVFKGNKLVYIQQNEELPDNSLPETSRTITLTKQKEGVISADVGKHFSTSLCPLSGTYKKN
jgi:hypothetical protein